MKGLTAEERAVQILRAFKEGREEDTALRKSLPPEQGDSLGYLIDLVKQTNRHFAWHALYLKTAVDELEVRVDWLTTLAIVAPRLGDGPSRLKG